MQQSAMWRMKGRYRYRMAKAQGQKRKVGCGQRHCNNVCRVGRGRADSLKRRCPLTAWRRCATPGARLTGSQTSFERQSLAVSVGLVEQSRSALTQILPLWMSTRSGRCCCRESQAGGQYPFEFHFVIRMHVEGAGSGRAWDSSEQG